MKLHPDAHEHPEDDTANDEPAPLATLLLGAFVSHKIATPPNAKVSDGSQPPVTFDLSLSETAGSRSLHRLVGPCAARARDSVSSQGAV